MPDARMNAGGAPRKCIVAGDVKSAPDMQRTARCQDDSCVAAKSIRAARAFRTLETWPRRSGHTTCTIRAPAFIGKPHAMPICTI
ncbi:hypothetical protein Bcep18194_C6758 [Burkholderia lata]|uniref:Uncharacterized protein n=1 Tax=Burkholderia lata (strain ATCC 17760 / DSM 23089 / LMG 22485 / NCIMB 9086 / R18194 / 383) TaxID=482957 RepID=Q39P11_BURL3|nr:hypothetical protein Bcep18194_C6758 [Burkholderia lata]